MDNKKGNTDYGSNNETRTSVLPYRNNFTTKSSKNQVVLPINNDMQQNKSNILTNQEIQGINATKSACSIIGNKETY